MAERAAIVDAYGTAARLLMEALPKAASGQAEYSVFLRGGRIARSDVAPDGSVKVALEVPLSPELVGEVKDYLTVLFATRGVDEVIAEEMAVFMGMEELYSLLQIRLQWEGERFDCLIVDCAPTGGTMRLLSFPDVARWYMEKLFPWERRIVTTMGPFVQPFVPVPLPKDNVYAANDALFMRIDGMKEVLCDPKQSSNRLVLNQEKMVIKEAQRALTYLNLYGYVTDAVICNRVFPRQLRRGYFAE